MGIRFYLNPDDVLAGVYAVVNGDAILKGSSYLNTTGLAVYTTRLPRDVGERAILIEANPAATVTMSQTYDFEIRIHSYVDLLPNGQINTVTNKISERCEQLLNDTILSIVNATCRPMVSLAPVPAYYDDEDSVDKGHAILRLQVRVDPT